MPSEVSFDLIAVLRDGGFFALFVLIIVAGHRGFWVYSRNHEEMKAQYESRIRELESRIDDKQKEVEWWREQSVANSQQLRRLAERIRPGGG